MKSTMMQIWTEIYEKAIVENKFLMDLLDDWKISRSSSIEELIQSRNDYADWLKKMVDMSEEHKL